MRAIEARSKLYAGPRMGFAVKAAHWVKKVFVNRGHVEVGALDARRRFVIDPSARPVYAVPPGLATSRLQPYVAPYDEKTPLKQTVVAAEAAAGQGATATGAVAQPGATASQPER
jgi:hypothetical protein